MTHHRTIVTINGQELWIVVEVYSYPKGDGSNNPNNVDLELGELLAIKLNDDRKSSQDMIDISFCQEYLEDAIIHELETGEHF